MLRVSKLTAGYVNSAVCAVQNLCVEKGEIVALMGPSGCGKTTFLRTLSGELPPMSGAVEVREYDRRLVRTIQGAPLLHWLTVRENAELAAQIRGTDISDLTRVFSELGISHLVDAYPDRLSGGERVRAALAQALLGTPSALLLDEPFSHLDFIARRSAANTAFGYVKEHEIPTIFVTHDVSDATTFADRILLFDSGTPSALHSLDIPNEQVRVRDIERLMEMRSCAS